ncbi:uncharacterized protein [Arachis hypogaea]|uniref:Endonuclease/exonuclease/phosphatase domain-containing protein n=2 Tax=Arachis hypogaea TaxID=3818 RepID=A0A444Y0E0_ARAHY|nr:uncharacterized protein LOC114925792 [Arachis hypogaea]RYQ95391.1 hypothetical protein Ahy_B08g090662 isoform A [Arachis hypogaea]
MINQYKPDITILLEIKCSRDTATRVIQHLGFTKSIREEAQGFVGGIWILWNRMDIDITMMEMHSQYIHVRVQVNGEKERYLTAVYASPNNQIRKLLWPKLVHIANSMAGDWLVAGDFNEIKEASEKKGGAAVNIRACNIFSNWINSCRLIDLGFVGPRFTWKGPKWEGQDRVFKRLDRALSNHFWRTRFHKATTEVLTRTNSDHHPILIQNVKLINGEGKKPFRFEAMWTHHPDFQHCLKDSWNRDNTLPSALRNLKNDLLKWNKDIFGNIFKANRTILNRITGIQRSASYGNNPFLEELEQKLNKELNDILDREKTFWMQKSRQNWIIEGDRNTRYYHTKTIVRRGKNKILKLRDTNENWIEDEDTLKTH